MKTFTTNNDIPFCGGEAADRFLYFSALVDDFEPYTISKADIAEIWAILTRGVNPPGKCQF